jgi:hypothetical protein
MLKSVASIFIIVIITALALIIPSAITMAAVTCKGTLTSITVQNIQVPSGYACTLKGTIVKGDIIVNNGAILKATGIRVIGSIRIMGTAFVEVDSNSVIQNGIISIE